MKGSFTGQFSRFYYCLMLCIISYTSFGKVRYVKTIASGLADGSSWANASNGLQLMINNSSSGDEIWVALGTYRPTRLANNTATISGVLVYPNPVVGALFNYGLLVCRKEFT